MTTRFSPLYLLLLLTSKLVLADFNCPKSGLHPCHCTMSLPEQFRIYCPSPNGAAVSGFDLTIQPEQQVRLHCRNSPDWADLLPGTPIGLGALKSFVVASCSSPGATRIRRIMRQLNVTEVEYLKYEHLRGQLTAEDLDVFPKIKYLVLSGNRMDRVDADLLRGLPNLKQLDLRNTNIQIPDGFFDTASNLKSLELSENNLKDLKPGVFDGLKQIELLNLWKNEFFKLKSDVFRNLDSLISLDIHQNNLNTLPVDIFKNLKNLEVINFSSNNFSSLPEGIFQHNSKLKIVKLLYNKSNFTGIPSKFLANLANLRSVSFMRSRISSLPDDLFWSSSSLIDLNLNRNYLTTLPANIFKDTVELHSLTVSLNYLKELPDEIFANTRKLVKLDLSRNDLTVIKERTFVGLDSLRELNMESNNLIFIHADAFSSLGELKIAKFANNKLTLRTNVFDMFGQVSPFHSCSSLEELDLSHNNITEMFSDWVISSVRLHKLDLSYNSFDYLETEDLQFLSNTVHVNLCHNSITHVNLARLEHISADQSMEPFNQARNVSVALQENPIQCDCDVYSLLRYLNGDMLVAALNFVHLELDNLVCDGPDYMRGIKLAEIHSTKLKCRVENEQPRANDPCAPNAECDCWLRPADRTLIVDCASRNLSSPPEWIDARGIDRVELDLAMNELRAPPDMTAKGYDKVYSLNIAGNHIDAIDENLVSSNLMVLNLDGNNLTNIDSKVLQKLSNSSQLIKLTLHDNPWRCDCDSLELLSFVQSNFLDIPDLLNITCSKDNVYLSKLSPSDLCPSSHRLIIILCSLVSGFGLLLGSLVALYFRYQQQIKIWLYSRNLCLCLVTEDEVDRDKTYDAFVSYSHRDEEFVLKELVAHLEDGQKPYKLCIHSRDWLAGEWIPTQIVRSVEESRRTIVVLSHNFIESVWARLEFQTAHKQALSEKRVRVIVILYGEIEITDILDPELKAYLQMNTYIKWGDPSFWQKLRYAMPHSFGDLTPQKNQKGRNNGSIIDRPIVENKNEDAKITMVDELAANWKVVQSDEDVVKNLLDDVKVEDKLYLTA